MHKILATASGKVSESMVRWVPSNLSKDVASSVNLRGCIYGLVTSSEVQSVHFSLLGGPSSLHAILEVMQPHVQLVELRVPFLSWRHTRDVASRESENKEACLTTPPSMSL